MASPEAVSPVDEGGGGSSPPTNTVFCLYCRATIYFPGLPANRYMNHLFTEHNIMYEVQSVINRTLALQLPKEYPELAEGSMSLPDSSNRLSSPVPSSVGGASPAPASQTVFYAEKCIQTDFVKICTSECQTDSELDLKSILVQVHTNEEGNVQKVQKVEKVENGEKVEKGVGKEEVGREGKRTEKEKVKEEVKRMIDEAGKNRKFGVTCQICKVRYKKLHKLKFHIMKQHAKQISENLHSKLVGEVRTEKESQPGRKSSRIELKKDEERGEPKPDIKSDNNQEIPTSLILPKDEEWSEGCRYFCMLCSNSFSSFGVYKHHIGNFHGMLIEEYRAKFGKHGEVISKLNCKICQQTIVHKNSAIKAHMKSAHNMSISEYRDNYILNQNIEDEIEDRDMEVEDAEIAEDAEMAEDVEWTENAQLKDGRKDYEAEDEEEEEEEEEVMMKAGDLDEIEIDEGEMVSNGDGERRRWYEGCSYVCIPCNKNYDIYFSYHGHVKKIHNLSMEQYHAEYGQEGETNRYYSCKICNTNVVWRMFNIRKHLESQHNLSMEDYSAKYEPDSRSKTQDFSKAKSAGNNLSIVQKTENKILEDEEVWYEGCLYTCQMLGCNKMFNLSESYHKHITSFHQIDLQTYHKKFGTKGEVYKQYECLICNARIAHKYNNIASHITLIHDLSMSEYEQDYIPYEDTIATGEMDIIEDQDQESELIIESEEGEDGNDGEEGNEEERYEFTEEDIIIEETPPEVKEPITDGASEHAWYHGSDLTCQICFKNFANDQWYFHHFSKIHGITKEQYNEKYGKDAEIYHQYQCLICNSKIRWKYSSIRQHLKQVHGTNIQDYEVKYMDSEPELLTIDPLSALREQARNPCHDVSSIKPVPSSLPPPPPLKASPAALLAGRVSSTQGAMFSPPTLSKAGSLTFESRPETQWYHGSDLTCLICNKSFVDFTYYCTHIRTVHQISKERYNDKYGTGAEAFRLYRCLVCHISIKWTYQSICGHLKSHEISIKDYELKYPVLENQSTESGKISDLTMNVRVGGGEGEGSPKKMKLEDVPPVLPTLSDMMGSPRQFDLNSMLVPNPQKPKPSRISADISSPTGKWYNQCKFTCKACPEEKYFTVPQALRMHLNGIHSLTRKEYESRYGNAETVTKYWTCLMCNKELKCQKGIIIQHLLNVHTLELVDYERQYMDAGDQVVARENRKPRKNARVPLPSPLVASQLQAEASQSFVEASDLSSFLVQRMQEGPDNVTLEGPVITGEVGEAPDDAIVPYNPQHSNLDDSVTSMSSLEVEGMDYVPWYFGCRYSCQICNKNWHYPQACRYHLDSVHKLSRAQYETEYGSCEIETRIFNCSLCTRTMKCERDIIKYHLEAKHSMSLEEYEEQVPNPVVTIGESRRSNSASHSRTSSLTGTQFIPISEGSPAKPGADGSSDPRIPWYRGSNFTCIPCNRQFTAQVSYISHINSKHGMNLREYREQFGSQEEIKQYNCRVPGCTRFVSWTYSGINDHLKSHSLTMGEYEQQYLNQLEHLPKDEINVEPVESLEKMVDMWSVGESRICAVCETTIFGDVGKFNTHITESHAISLDQYTTLHGSSEKKKKHCCLVCGEDVELLPGILAAHLQTHSLFPQQYYHKYILNKPKKGLSEKAESPSSSSNDKSPKTSGSLPKPPSLQIKPTSLLLKQVDTKSEPLDVSKPVLDPSNPVSDPSKQVSDPSKQVSDPSKQVSDPSKQVSDPSKQVSDPSKQVSDPSKQVPDTRKPLVFKVRKNHWANGCTYRCVMCPEITFPEEFVFKKHIQLAHNMAADKYSNNFGSAAVSLQLHTCQVCKKNVKHEYTAILNHLRVKHMMTLTTYTQMYIKPSQDSTDLTPSPVLSHARMETDGGEELDDDGEFYTVYT